MTNSEKTKIILEQLDHVIPIDWNQEELFSKFIQLALNMIDAKNQFEGRL